MSELEWTHLLDRARHWQREEVGDLIDELRAALEASRAREAKLVWERDLALELHRTILARVHQGDRPSIEVQSAAIVRLMRIRDLTSPESVVGRIARADYDENEVSAALSGEASTPAPPADREARLLALMETINRIASPKIDCTLDRAIEDLGLITDFARTGLALAPSDGETADETGECSKCGKRGPAWRHCLYCGAALRKEGE